MILYIHINKINDKKYVGITSQESPEKRFGVNGNNYRGSYFWEKGISQFGWDNFKHIILSDELDEESARQIEARLINTLKLTDPQYGYNEDSGSIIKKNPSLDIMAETLIKNKIESKKPSYLDYLQTDYKYVSNTYTLDYLHSLWISGKINTEMDCQRDYIWTEDRQQGMWDTLLRGQIIPELHTIRNGMNYDVIDGKQRITTIMKIISDEIPLIKKYSTEFTKPLLEEMEVSSIFFSKLPQILKDRILNTTVRFCEYSDISEEGIMELFRKLNASMALSTFNQGLTRNIHIKTKFLDRLLSANFIKDLNVNNDEKDKMLTRVLILLHLGVCNLQPMFLEQYYPSFTVPILNKYYKLIFSVLEKIPTEAASEWNAYAGKMNYLPTALYLLERNEITPDDFLVLPQLIMESKVSRRGCDLGKNRIFEDIKSINSLLEKFKESL